MEYDAGRQFGRQNHGRLCGSTYAGGEIDFVDTSAQFNEVYPLSRYRDLFGKGWDDLKTLTDEFVTTAQEKISDERQVIVSNM